MKRLYFFILLAFMLLLPATTSAYASEDLTYTSYVDEVAGMKEPRWSFDFYPQYVFEHKFLIFQWGKSEIVSWNIETVSFYFNLINEHKGIANVGYNRFDFDVNFTYVYSSVDSSFNKYTSTATFTYPLEEYCITDDYVEFDFPYKEVLSGSEYYNKGYDTVIKSVEISISSRVFETHGTVVHYEFYVDEDYSKNIYTGIDYYLITGDDLKLMCTEARIFQEDTENDGNGGTSDLCHFLVVLPDTAQEVAFEVNDILTMILIDFPKSVWNVIKFFFVFIAMIPGLIHTVVPFIPEYIIAGVMFVVVFGIVWGIIAWIRCIKGD